MEQKKNTHANLVAKGAAYLRYHLRCNPILTEHASCNEIPDIIGWRFEGSTVIECKTSIADYRNDAEKYIGWRKPGTSFVNYWTRKRRKQFEPLGYIPEKLNNMGTQRYFLSSEDIITEEMVRKDHPDHGLLHLKSGRVIPVIAAPIRKSPDLENEVRLLRLSLVHVHKKLCSLGVYSDIDDLTRHNPRNYIASANWEIENYIEEKKLGGRRQRGLFEEK